jgi:hypothetical protein
MKVLVAFNTHLYSYLKSLVSSIAVFEFNLSFKRV